MEARLTIVTLGVANLADSRRFYGEGGLGFPLLPESNDGIAFFLLNGLRLALYPHAALAEDATVAPAPVCGFRGFTLAHNVRSRDEVIAVLAEAERAGATLVKPAQDVFWGGFSGYFSDPDGFLWEVAYNPFLTL